ncbi:MAG TPA: ubiquinol-cytochrome c reductase iron-sulfur subunit [Pyrinomonadaceae bacterium]|nr:ubiquinol-cytochrome c reductase iron-sulfur subunit [Pyrinomonadaceae bacterium]
MTTKPGNEVSRFDPEPIPRRDFLGLAAIATTAVTFLFSLFGMLKLPKAAVSASPAKKFNVTLPDALAAGEAYVPPGRNVAVFRDADGVFAISTVCTHLGCIVKTSKEGFDCPCHGSGFAADGTVRKGPAPKPLPWIKVTKSGSAYVVDEENTVPAGTKV